MRPVISRYDQTGERQNERWLPFSSVFVRFLC